MKAMKKFLAVLLTLTLVAALIPAAFAADPAYSLTISNDESGYVYEAYQIFKGDVSGTAGSYILSNVEWGDGITDAGKAALKTLAGITADDATASDIAAGLVSQSGADVAGAVANNLATKKGTVNAVPYTFGFDEAGYYFVKNTKVPEGETDYEKAYSDYIVKVFGEVTAQPKSAHPTVDKQVLDDNVEGDRETSSSDGWGETADHQIGDEIHFKLIAEIPNDDNIDLYDTYKLVFKDTMDVNQALTFKEIVSVTMTGLSAPIPVAAGENGGYVCTASDGTTTEFSVTIPNLKKFATSIKAKIVTVEYIAVLNSNARAVAPGTSEADSAALANKNSVYLQYSNNPNSSDSFGKTEEDTVFVFTYEMPNMKYKNEIADGNELDGAQFTLYTNYDNSTKTYDGAVKLTWDDTKKAYIYDGTTENTVMESKTDGSFKVYGLDVGTYYLVETHAPDGYNTCAPKTIVISATHSENDSKIGTTKMTMNGTEQVNNFVNKQGTVLPETGGIGTTLFYVFGSILVIGAGVLLVSKKRMGAAE